MFAASRDSNPNRLYPIDVKGIILGFLKQLNADVA
jgi:hypothetical protein